MAEDSDRAWLDALDSIGYHHPRLALMISQDTVVETVVRHAELLRRRYEFVLPDPGTVRLLGDKTEFAVWAHAQGFPVPRTHVVTSQEELDTALHQVRYPAVLKPFRRDHRWHAASGRTKAHLLDSPEAAGELPFRPFDASSRYVLQEWIDGGDSDVHFCLTYRDRTGGELGRKTGRKIVQWPIGTGNTAICTTTDDPILSELTTDLFDRAGLVGLGSLEVKRDRRDGRYYITEPTVGRPNLQSNVATAAGTNLIAIAHHDACRSAIPTPGAH